MTITEASINDNEVLTDITKKSKAYWGYSEEQILKWNESLTITKEYIETNSVFKLMDNDKSIGYYSYLIKDEKNVILDNLFILPEYIGTGLGKYLMSDFLNRMKNENFEKITLNSEPNAENFYLKFGFEKIGEFETSIKDRFMPIMEVIL